MTVANRNPIAMSQAPITPGNATYSERARAYRYAMSDVLLRQAPEERTVQLTLLSGRSHYISGHYTFPAPKAAVPAICLGYACSGEFAEHEAVEIPK